MLYVILVEDWEATDLETIVEGPEGFDVVEATAELTALYVWRKQRRKIAREEICQRHGVTHLTRLALDDKEKFLEAKRELDERVPFPWTNELVSEWLGTHKELRPVPYEAIRLDSRNKDG